MKILVFTGTRAEYGILFWLLKDLQSHSAVDLQLVVSGAHLCQAFGSTFKDIEQAGFHIDRKIDTLLVGETPGSTARSVGLSVMAYADAVEAMDPDIVVLLGDRFETFAMAQAAFFMQVPVAHIHGGELSEGANDDRMRHAITKLSDLHFTSTAQHKQRVEQLGEQPGRVFNVGAPGLEHLERSELPSIETLSETFAYEFDQPYVVIAYHSVTNADNLGIDECRSMLVACSKLAGYQFVLSAPNADYGSAQISALIADFCDEHGQRTLLRASFGHENFLSLVKHAAFIIGNSSSAIIEAPSLGTPSIDVGDRQKGRAHAQSVLHVDGTSVSSIDDAISTVLNTDLPDHYFINPYQRNGSSSTMIDTMLSTDLTAQKTFNDTVPGTVE